MKQPPKLDLEARFTPPDAEPDTAAGVIRSNVRLKYLELARQVSRKLPMSRELSETLTCLETSMLWALEGVTRNGSAQGDSGAA